MILNQKPAMRRTLRSSASSTSKAAPTPLTTQRGCALKAQQQDERVADTGSRRNFLSMLGLMTGLSAASAAQAADPYEELKALSAARNGSASLLESFEGTKGAVSGGKISRGIRERLAAEAAPAKSSGGFFGGSSSSGISKAPKSSVAAAPKPFSAAPTFKPFSAPSAPKAAAPKPAASASAAGAAGGSGGGFAAGPLVQAAGVLGLVGVGASVATSAATSKPKAGKPAAAAAAAPAAQPARAATPSLRKSESSTGKVNAAAPAAAAAAAKPATTKVVSRPVSPAAARAATGKVLAGAAAAKSATAKVVKKGAAGAAASGSTVKTVVKQALVNEESPDQPTDFATGGFLGFVGLLAAFLLFGLPKSTVVAPTTSAPTDPLVEEARQAGVLASQSSKYTTPLYKAAGEEAAVAGSSSRKAIISAPKLADDVVPARKAPAVVAPPVLPPKPAAVEAPKPAPAAAPVLKVEAAPAPKPAGAPAPAAAVKAPEQKAAAASATEGPSAAQNLLVVAGGIAVVVTAFALTGGSSDSTDGGAPTATSTPAAAGASGGADAAAATAAVSAAAEGVSAAASAAAATSAPTEGAQQGNAAYDKVVLALMADPEVTEDLFSVMSQEDAALKNIPALAWALISTPSNAINLDGFAFQKLSTQRYERVRQLLLDGGLQLPDSPRVQAGAAVKLAPSGAVDSSEVDPEKLRGVFEALLSNEASRGLMRQLLKGAGMPFNEEAFEEQVKDSTYFNLAIAPILRSMPQQKLKVLAELQDPEKLQQLVSSVSLLAKDGSQLEAVTAELSSDVKQTVNTIREAEQQAEQRAASGSGNRS